MTLREQLLEMSEPGYRKFISPLMPGAANVLGVRLPLLRRIAREIARGRLARLPRRSGGVTI